MVPMTVGGRTLAGRMMLVLLCALPLAACSDEPSEGEMRTVVENATRRKLEASRVPFRQFDVFRKQGCVTNKTQARQYDCYYAATFQPQLGTPPLTVNGKGRFTRKDSTLMFEDLGAQPR
mgnify:CR=1 FL=1